MKLVLLKFLLLLSLTIQAQFQEVVTLPTDHPVNNSIVLPQSLRMPLFEDYCKANLFKNLDDLLNGDTIFIKQFIGAYNSSGSALLLFRILSNL